MTQHRGRPARALAPAGPAAAVERRRTDPMAKVKAPAYPVLVCTPRRLPVEKLQRAADIARRVNPLNHPPVERLVRVMADFRPSPARIAVMTTKYWGVGGVRLTVGFLDNPPAALRRRILSHLNAWSKTANVKFTEARTDPQVRIARDGGANGGYW